MWIGQVSRDIGVRLTDRTWNLTTHKIGPDIDFDRSHLLQESAYVRLRRTVPARSGRRSSADITQPRTDLTGDPYFTDGLRLVVFLSSKATPLTEVSQLPWD